MNNEFIKNKINALRNILNKQIENDEKFESIIETSIKIDLLLNIYYKSIYIKQ